MFLGNAGRLELLRELGGGRVAVPDTVLQEVIHSSHADRASAAVESATWIESLAHVEIAASVAVWDLDDGEAQVIATGLVNRPARLVIDDLAGRRCALAHGFEVIGTLGVVVAAFRRGLVDDPAQVFTELREAGMWISNGVLARALELSGTSK